MMLLAISLYTSLKYFQPLVISNGSSPKVPEAVMPGAEVESRKHTLGLAFIQGTPMGKPRKFEDLTGMKFGDLIVAGLHEELSSNGQRMWDCVCSCGANTRVREGRLVNGETTKCRTCGGRKRQDITGMIFGKLYVERHIYEKNSGNYLWMCVCECGRERIVAQGLLKRGIVKSCKLCSGRNGVRSQGFASYLMNNGKLPSTDGVHRFKENEDILGAVCTYCGKKFAPRFQDVHKRIESINTVGKVGGLYCSVECKNACPTYRSGDKPRGFRQSTSREVSVDLRKEVLKRDNWECQKCGATDKQLHVHHERPAALSPLTAHDPDVCITLCKDCHKEVHQKKGCRYVELHRKECK